MACQRCIQALQEALEVLPPEHPAEQALQRLLEALGATTTPQAGSRPAWERLEAAAGVLREMRALDGDLLPSYIDWAKVAGELVVLAGNARALRNGTPHNDLLV